MSWKRYFLGLLVCLSFIVGCEKKTDWRENFREKSRTPFGLFILYNESPELFHEGTVIKLEDNLLDYLNNLYFEEESQFNYICIKEDAEKLNQQGVDKLLSYVEDGSTAFFSLNNFSIELQQALGFETKSLEPYIFEWQNMDNTAYLKDLKGELKLTNKDFKEQSYSYDRNLRRNYFANYDTYNTVVLGTQEIEGKDEAVFLKVYYGQGIVYLHTQPTVFTNYNLLNDNYEYAERALSYLPEGDVIWDPQRRWSYQDRNSNSDSDSGGDTESIFNFFLANPSLKWFLYLAFTALITFLLFNARRKQRPIPIIDPPKNSTLEFTHTISNLYLLNGDHNNMIDKKIQYFLEKVRSQYYLDTRNLNQEFIEKLASKSGNDLVQTRSLVNYIIALNRQQEGSPSQLMELSRMIDKFFKRK
jgi:hypothetical protein